MRKTLNKQNSPQKRRIDSQTKYYIKQDLKEAESEPQLCSVYCEQWPTLLSEHNIELVLFSEFNKI